MNIGNPKNYLFSLMIALLFVGCSNSQSKGQQTQVSKSSQNGAVQMTEFSDFECPACAYYYPIVQKLKKHYGDKLEITYKYFPLNSHQYSMLAARAARAADNQGKFLAMHDMLFSKQKTWAASGNPQPIFVNYAQEMGLDISKFKDDLNAAETQKAVIQQKQEGVKRGVNSTPTFFINGQKVLQLPRTYDQFKALLDEFMKEASQKAQS